MVKRTTPHEGYPLQWPSGWPRTEAGAHKNSRYEQTHAKALEDLLDDLRRMGARRVVVSCNVKSRNDGLPFTTHYSEPNDPGVAVYWTDKQGNERVMACDCWRTVRENTRAIAVTIASLRRIERAGATELLERAFTGFAALPANIMLARPWRQVLGFDSANGVSLNDVKARYRKLAAERHPDTPDGSHERMAELNHAYENAQRELSA